MKNYILAIIVSVVGFTACETKIDLNADYKQIPVIYGLLEANKDIQLIKINRSFLGESNALVAAQIPDSTFYTNINPVIEKFDGINVIDTRVLRDTILPDREPGDFYISPNKYYYFSNSDGFLEDDKSYRLKFTANGVEISAETVLLENFNANSPAPNQPAISIVRNDAILQNKVEYQNFDYKVITKKNVRLYESELVVRYTTNYLDGTTKEQEVLVAIDDLQTTQLNGNQTIGTNISGEQIMNIVGSNAKFEVEDQESVRFREIGDITLRITAATDDFNTYLESIAPASGVVLEKPQYTNINFGEDDLGVGIFTSRNTYSQDYPWDTRTVKAFAVAEGTKDYRFCSFKPEVQGVSRVDCRTYN